MKKYRNLNTKNLIVSLGVLIVLFYVSTRYFGSNIDFLHIINTPVANAGNFIQKKARIPFEYFASFNSLQKENLELKTELEQNQLLLQSYEELFQENKRLRKLLDIPSYPNYKKKVASVTGKSPDIWHKEITINIGKKDGVGKDYSVISFWGLLGRVKSVTNYSSVVQLIIDNSNWVSCLNNRSRHIGLLQAENSKLGHLSYLINKSDFRQNDLIVTSGLGGIYPKGIPVGIVSRVKKKSGDSIPEIDIEYLSDFDDIEDVIVLIKNE